MTERVTDRPAAGCPRGPSPDRAGSARRMNRRTALRVAGGGTVGLFAVGALVACAEDPITEPDVLVAQEFSARSDAAAATAAIAIEPQRTDALTVIAAERTAHAAALRTEIDRAIGVYGDGTTPAVRTPAPTTTAAPDAPPSIAALRDQLTSSQRAASDLAVTQSGYRAGLLASISAACAVQVGVLLV
ncbi:hypothetical protein ACWDO0_25445 [Nocardia rhamnosiphila]|uniref:Uncharacterized protein n=1 Tax=Nocardia rhamnosiphila TaxID=426716 RepID=A0ABV2X1V7_9NOCA|nr:MULTISPECIES: hypothetical protein [Nocardia]